VADDFKPKCQVCNKATSPRNGTVGDLLRPSLLEFIQKKAPAFESSDFICLDDLGNFRRDYVKQVLESEIGELTALDQEVVDSLQQHEILSENIGKEFEQALSFGQRLSDKIADFGGSWPFIIFFGVGENKPGSEFFANDRPGIVNFCIRYVLKLLIQIRILRVEIVWIESVHVRMLLVKKEKFRKIVPVAVEDAFPRRNIFISLSIKTGRPRHRAAILVV